MSTLQNPELNEGTAKGAGADQAESDKGGKATTLPDFANLLSQLRDLPQAKADASLAFLDGFKLEDLIPAPGSINGLVKPQDLTDWKAFERSNGFYYGAKAATVAMDLLMGGAAAAGAADRPLESRAKDAKDGSDKKTVKLDAESEVFRAEDGSVIVYREGSPGTGSLFISRDGKNFYEVAVTGFGGSKEDHEISFEDPLNKKKGNLVRKGDEITLDSKTFKKGERPESIEAIKLPEIREATYMFKLPDGRYLYVSQNKYNFTYEGMKVYIGKPGDMKEVKVEDVMRFRDGGTTIMKTKDGTLFVPTFLDRNKKPTWNGQEITEVQPADFDISESAGILTLKPKKK